MRFEPGTTGSGRAILRREYVLEDAAARQRASPPSTPSSSTRWTCWKGWLPSRRRTETIRRAAPRNVSCDDWRAPRASARARRRRKTKRRERIRTGAAIRIWRRTTPSARSMTSRAKTPDDRGARNTRTIRRRRRWTRWPARRRLPKKRESRRIETRRHTLDAGRRSTRRARVCTRRGLARFRCLSPPPRGSDPRKTRTPRTFAPRGVGTPRVGTPSSRARASRAVRHRPGRGDGRRRVSGGARGVVGGGGATARRRVDASLAPSGRRGRRAGCRWRLGTPIGTLVASGALVTRANDATRVEARRASSPRGVRGGGRRGLPRRRSASSTRSPPAFRHVARRGASRDGEVTGSKPNARGNEEDDDEMDPSDAARHVLAAAEALQRRVASTSRRKEKDVRIHPGGRARRGRRRRRDGRVGNVGDRGGGASRAGRARDGR